MSQSAASKNGLDLFGLCKHLHEAGWDAFASDLVGEISARREHPSGRGACNLVIDRAGRWRFTATREIRPSAKRELVLGGRPFRLQQQEQHVLRIAGKLHTSTELPEILADLTQLAAQEESAHTDTVEGSAWTPPVEVAYESKA